MAQAAHKTCEICMRASALHFCTQCEQVFCDDCKVSHLRSKISRNHTFMVGGCKDHNEDFIYLCEDCDQLICRVCVTKAHQKHYLVDIKDSNNKVKTEISKCLDSKVDNIRSSAKLIEEKAKTYKTEVEATVKGIIEQGNIIKAMVDKKVNALIKVLRERERIELQSLSKANKDCPDLLGEASIHQQIYQDMIKQCDEVASFHKMKKIKSDVDNLKTVDITSLPSATYNRKNVNFSDVDQLFGNVTFQETEVTVKKTKLSAELHNQDKQPKQEMKKDQPPTTKEDKRDRAYILEFLESFPETVDKIERMTEVSSTDIVVNVPREENIDMVRFSEAMAHVFNSMMKIKNQLIKTEQDLKNKLSNIVNWTNDQGQSEKEEIRIHQGIVDDKNKQLERAYILELLKSFPEIVDNIEHMTEASSTAIHLPRHDNVVMVRFSEEMEHVFNSMMKIKNQLIKTEQDLKNKLSNIVNWTNDQGQSNKEEKRIHQGIVDDKNKQLEILKKDQAIKDEKIKQLEALNKNLHQLLQGKRNLKKLETECNQLKEEQAKLLNQRQQGAQQYHKLCKENKDLQEGLKTAGEIINESQKKVTDLESEVHGLKVPTEKKEHAIKALRAEKDDCLNSMAGDKLTKGNPAITHLPDPNRPIKIAEKYGELYDNEWTDAMDYSDDTMRKLFPKVYHPPFDEILVFHLHRLVMCCYRKCLKLATEQEQTMRSAVINPMTLQIDEDGTDLNNMPGYREIVNVRRQNAQQFANTLFQKKMISMTTIITDWDYIYKNEELIGQLLETPFFDKCVHLCWYMVIQDPVMYMTEEIKPDTVYDRDVYKEFMQSGDKVKYVVWPALFLHEGGPLLYKGVVQAYK